MIDNVNELYWTPANPDYTEGFDASVVLRSPYLVVDVADMKNYLRNQHNKDDEFLASLIRSATISIENYINDFIFPTQVSVYFSRVRTIVNLPYSNLSSQTIKTINETGTETTLMAGTNYYIRGNKRKFLKIATPTNDQLKANYTCGLFASPSLVDSAIVDAVKAQVKFLYQMNSGATPDAQVIVNLGLTVQAQMLVESYRDVRTF